MPGILRLQDTFYVGTLKGVGRAYQQTYVDTYAKVGFAKLYDRKTPLTAADLLNDLVIPFYEENGIPLQRVLTDRGTEILRNPRPPRIPSSIWRSRTSTRTRTKAKSPQTNGIVERFHKTMLDEFYRIAFRKKIYTSIEDLQADLDLWMREFNEARPHQGKWCFSERPRCRPSPTLCRSQRENPSRSPRASNQPRHDLKRPARTPSVRSSRNLYR